MSCALEQELARLAREDTVLMGVIAVVSFAMGAGIAIIFGAIA